jgi:hypothetical protein
MRFLAFLLLFFSSVSWSQSDGWIHKNRKDGIDVYYKRTSDFHELKLTTSIQSSLSAIIHLLNDTDRYPSWGYKILHSHLVNKISEKESIYRSTIDFPWPLDDRDIVMHSRLTQDEKTKTVYSISEAVPKAYPIQNGMVRITTSRTKWTLVPGANGWIYVEYYLYSSPGGNIPDWLVNLAIDVGPRETILRMKNVLQQPAYKNVKLAYIKE